MTDSCKNVIEKSMEPRLLWRSSYYQYQTASNRKSYSFRSNLKGPGLRLHQVPIKQNGSTTSWPCIKDNMVLPLQGIFSDRWDCNTILASSFPVAFINIVAIYSIGPEPHAIPSNSLISSGPLCSAPCHVIHRLHKRILL